MELNRNVIMFAGGGTGGHIYPGLAVADELKSLAEKDGRPLALYWLGCSKGMDRQLVERAVRSNGAPVADAFFGIPSGKLRRYFSLQNFTDLFRIAAGYICARRLLKRHRPAVLFSKGGFVSVPPCLAAKHLGIPVVTHECDFTLGLANRLNFRSAQKLFVSYEETKSRMSEADQRRVVVTGNPVRPVFYEASAASGRKFLGLPESLSKPVLLVLGGSSGARQINDLVIQNLDWLCGRFIVVHQCGLVNGDESEEHSLKEKYAGGYLPYQFIHKELPDVLACADVVLSRAGANSIWEAAVLQKPMVLVPLCGSGTRGDQVDNAEFFRKNGAAQVLLGEQADSARLTAALEAFLDEKRREECREALRRLTGGARPAATIAQELFSGYIQEKK